MDTGIYLNLFKVDFKDTPVDLMVAPRGDLPTLRELRATFQERSLQANVYQVESRVYGYGADQNALEEWGFVPTSMQIGNTPQLTAHLVLEGFVSSLIQAGYTSKWNKHGAAIYQLNTPLLSLDVGVMLYRGFELQSMYLNDPETDELFYAVVIDAVFTYRDKQGQALRPDIVAAQFESKVLETLLIKQGDLAAPGKINLEVARQRLLNQTLPFVQQRGTFTLPCGIAAQLNHEPIRVTLISDEEGV